MALRDNAGLIGKAQAPHIERRGYRKELRSDAASEPESERVCCF
jgi:hypothetical protein